jgi:hypothetical protein
MTRGPLPPRLSQSRANATGETNARGLVGNHAYWTAIRISLVVVRSIASSEWNRCSIVNYLNNSVMVLQQLRSDIVAKRGEIYQLVKSVSLTLALDLTPEEANVPEFGLRFRYLRPE